MKEMRDLFPRGYSGFSWEEQGRNLSGVAEKGHMELLWSSFSPHFPKALCHQPQISFLPACDLFGADNPLIFRIEHKGCPVTNGILELLLRGMISEMVLLMPAWVLGWTLYLTTITSNITCSELPGTEVQRCLRKWESDFLKQPIILPRCFFKISLPNTQA